MKRVIILLGVLMMTVQLFSNALPDPVMSAVLEYGSHEEISFREKYDEEGEDFYEVRLEKKKHVLVLLIDQDGYVVETIKDRSSKINM
jgi:hypothetical protein